MKKFLIVLGICAMAVSAVQATTWNILDQSYGSGVGQMSFNTAWPYYWGSTALPETDVDGKAILDLPAGGVHYPSLTALAGMPSDGSPVTVEFKMALPGNTMAYLYDCDVIGAPNWNNIFMVNALFSGATPNTLGDYNQRKDLNIAPAGFDGSVAHTYTFVWDGSFMSLYLDNNPTKLADFLTGAGASADHLQFGWGFYGGAVASTVEMYSFKVATGAYAPVPEPATMLLLGSGLLILRRRFVK